MSSYGKTKAADILEQKLNKLSRHQPRRVISRNMFKLNVILDEIVCSEGMSDETKMLLIESIKNQFLTHIDSLKSITGDYSSYTKNVIVTNCNLKVDKIKNRMWS